MLPSLANIYFSFFTPTRYAARRGERLPVDDDARDLPYHFLLSINGFHYRHRRLLASSRMKSMIEQGRKCSVGFMLSTSKMIVFVSQIFWASLSAVSIFDGEYDAERGAKLPSS